MRQEMSKTHEKGPKKVDKGHYQDLMKEHAQQHADSIANAKTAQPESPPQAREFWRKND